MFNTDDWHSILVRFDYALVSGREATRLWLLDRVPLWLRSRWPLARFYWQPETLDKIKADAADLLEGFTGPNPELAQGLYDTRANLRESIIFHPLVVKQLKFTQEKLHIDIPEYRRVFTTVEDFDATLEQWIRIGLIVTDVTPEETVESLNKAVKL